MTEILAFDSTGLVEDDALERYRRLYAADLEVEKTPLPFFARVRSWQLDRSVLSVCEYGGIRHVRNEHGARDGLDHFVLHHVVSGELRAGAQGAPVRIAPGQTLILDARAPMEAGSANVRVITMSVTREAMLAAAGPARDLHGYCIGSREGALLGSLLRELIEQLPCLDAGAHGAVLRTLVDLLSVALHPAGATARSDAFRLEHARREAARQVIEANAGSLDFSVQDIMRATGMSRAGLYRLFEPSGGVVRYIQQCRLQRMRAQLDDRAFDGHPLAELAPLLGFSSESHAGRLFKQMFGVSPGAYRAASIRAQGDVSIGTTAFHGAGRLCEVA
jgi:AraC-like DNA-binding protein